MWWLLPAATQNLWCFRVLVQAVVWEAQAEACTGCRLTVQPQGLAGTPEHPGLLLPSP